MCGVLPEVACVCGAVACCVDSGGGFGVAIDWELADAADWLVFCVGAGGV